MKSGDLKEKSVSELQVLLLELARECFNLKMQKATSQLSKPSRIKQVRRNIAKIHTILTQKGVV
jgi:large subunit ribosomal protein L29